MYKDKLKSLHKKHFQDRIHKRESTPNLRRKQTIILDACLIGNFPARYEIRSPASHQFPAIGVYVDERIIPGFKYKVRPLPGVIDLTSKQKCLFGGRALVLKNIGRGYARRFTFEADENCLNNNENYFWSDNRPEGYAFELEMISEGDKFTVFDVHHEAQASMEIMKIDVSFK